LIKILIVALLQSSIFIFVCRKNSLQFRSPFNFATSLLQAVVLLVPDCLPIAHPLMPPTDSAQSNAFSRIILFSRACAVFPHFLIWAVFCFPYFLYNPIFARSRNKF
jgi:hypothetical protein